MPGVVGKASAAVAMSVGRRAPEAAVSGAGCWAVFVLAVTIDGQALEEWATPLVTSGM